MIVSAVYLQGDPTPIWVAAAPEQVLATFHGPWLHGAWVELDEVMRDEDGQVFTRPAYVKPAATTAVRVIEQRHVDDWLEHGSTGS